MCCDFPAAAVISMRVRLVMFSVHLFIFIQLSPVGTGNNASSGLNSETAHQSCSRARVRGWDFQLWTFQKLPEASICSCLQTLYWTHVKCVPVCEVVNWLKVSTGIRCSFGTKSQKNLPDMLVHWFSSNPLGFWVKIFLKSSYSCGSLC